MPNIDDGFIEALLGVNRYQVYLIKHAASFPWRPSLFDLGFGVGLAVKHRVL